MTINANSGRILLKPPVLLAVLALMFAAGALLFLLSASASPGTTERVSVDSVGAQGNGDSLFPTITTDGRFVVFQSDANLVADDNNGGNDIFVRDRQTGATERISVSTTGGDQDIPGATDYTTSISADGRFVAFASGSTNLVDGDTNGAEDVFVRDRQTGATTRVNVDSSGAQAISGPSFGPAISADGRFVAFTSFSSNLVPGDNSNFDVFVHDLQTGATERITADGSADAGLGGPASISADGRFIAFDASKSNLVPSDTNGFNDVFAYDRMTATTELVSVDSAGVQGNSYSFGQAISADGRFVAFKSDASNLVPGDTNGVSDIFVHDRLTGITERVSVDSGGAEANDYSDFPGISADGRFVAFTSAANNLVAGDVNDAVDVFVHDRQTGATQRVSVASDGTEGTADAGRPDISRVSVSGDGRFVAFASFASNLVAGDTNTCEDTQFVLPPATPAVVTRNCSDVFVHNEGPVSTESDSATPGPTLSASPSPTATASPAPSPGPAFFPVHVDFIPDSPATVSVFLVCTSGTVNPSVQVASEASPVTFTVVGPAGGAACAAAESPVPSGYSLGGSCAAPTPLITGLCTITNTQMSPASPSPTPGPVPTPMPTPYGQLEYVALGDSIATGFHNPPGTGYVDVFQGYVSADLNRLVHLDNLAINGATSQDLLNQLTTNQTARDAVSSADIVTWDIGGNDLLYALASYRSGTCGGDDGQDCLRAASATFKDNWSAIIVELQHLERPTTALRTMDVYDPLVGNPSVGAALVAIMKPYIDDNNGYMATTASANGIPIAKAYMAFNGPDGTGDPFARGYMIDDIHPNALGHVVIAGLFRGLGYGCTSSATFGLFGPFANGQFRAVSHSRLARL